MHFVVTVWIITFATLLVEEVFIFDSQVILHIELCYGLPCSSANVDLETGDMEMYFGVSLKLTCVCDLYFLYQIYHYTKHHLNTGPGRPIPL